MVNVYFVALKGIQEVKEGHNLTLRTQRVASVITKEGEGVIV